MCRSNSKVTLRDNVPLYNKNLKEMENGSVKKKKHKKSLHEILTPKEETKCRIFVNRDTNACYNILLLGKSNRLCNKNRKGKNKKSIKYQ